MPSYQVFTELSDHHCLILRILVDFAANLSDVVLVGLAFNIMHHIRKVSLPAQQVFHACNFLISQCRPNAQTFYCLSALHEVVLEALKARFNFFGNCLECLFFYAVGKLRDGCS